MGADIFNTGCLLFVEDGTNLTTYKVNNYNSIQMPCLLIYILTNWMQEEYAVSFGLDGI